ncbi:MAG: response regulator, partial [Anaerolineae bacterium]|nr:response regulator [Anaerolineae bacterium]
RQLVKSIPAWLDSVILRALEKNPDNRYQTAAAMAAALANAAVDTRESPTSSTPAPAVSRRPQIRVVLADDHPSLRAPLAAYLELAGDIAVVGEASDGREAIALAEQHQPDVILLDLNMPNMSGLDALPEIKKVSPKVRVLVLTGRDETPYIMRALRGGANGYILKTATEEDVVNAVRDVFTGTTVLGKGIAERLVEGIRTMRNIDPLNDDEHMVLRAIAAGFEDNEQIAQRLKLDPDRVPRLLMGIIDKLGVKTRAEAALMAMRAGWITMDDIRDVLSAG